MPTLKVSGNTERMKDTNSSSTVLESLSFEQVFEADSSDTVVVPADATPYDVKPPTIDELQFVCVIADNTLTLTIGGEVAVGKFFIIAGVGTPTTLTLTNNGASAVTARVILGGTKTIP